MHVQSFIPLVLATCVSAGLPDGFPTTRLELPPFGTELPTRFLPTPVEEPAEPTGLTTDEKCALHFSDGDADVARDTWQNSGADSFLSSFLEENGVSGWADNLFQSTVGGGGQGGSTYDCTNFPAESSCNSPGHELCVDYDPPEMFYVHISISNLYSSFIRFHEEMQDAMIVDLASKIKGIVDAIGPPPPDDNSIFGLLIGVFVFAAALAGPVWAVAAPATAAVSALNIAAASAQKSAAETPVDFENDLETTLGEFYANFADQVEDTVKSLFRGDFDALEGFDQDPVEFIVGQFSDGKMLDHNLVNPTLDGWMDAAVKMVTDGLVIQGMINQEYYVWQDFTIADEGACGEEDGHWVWMNDMCTTIGKNDQPGFAGSHPYSIADDVYDSITGDYEFDYEEILRNALDCGGEDPELTQLPPFDEVPVYPRCFCNFEIKVQDFYERTPDEYYY